MGRAFKDLIVQEEDGRPRLTFRGRDGTVLMEDVTVEVASTVLQEGDKWGALAANRLLELDDDGAPQAVAPEFTPAAAPAALASRERMSAAFGKIAAAVGALIPHLADGTRHITAAERNTWNGKADASAVNSALAGKAAASHTHTKAQVGLGNVDNTADSAKSVKYAASAGAAADSQKIGGKTLSMTLSDDTLRIEWR